MFSKNNKANTTSVGVFKKMYSQLKAFKNQGVDCYFLYIDHHYLVMENISTKEVTKCVPQNTRHLYKAVFEMIKKINPNFVYIRKMMADHRLIGFLQMLKTQENINIIMEFPTLPYDAEIRGKIVSNIDQHCRKELKNYIDLAINYHRFEEVFGIPAISIFNATDVESIPLSRCEQSNNEIHMIAVASLAKWHGYDRLIEGMGQYGHHGEYKVYLHIVGEEQTPGVCELLHNLTKKYYLQERVKFYGFKSGKALDELFDRSHIAVGSLGLHRINLKYGSTIKEQEYCARGLPFINAFENTAFNLEYQYKLTFPGDETPIEIEKIISFYQKLIKDRDFKTKIRQYAENHLTWDHSFKPVFGWMKKIHYLEDKNNRRWFEE